MFYSRPQLPQLGIDLVEVDGGLGRPSQYRGRTVDGRPIVLGYDRGRLSIATEDQRDRLGEELVSVQIGPNFNGDMLLEQICDLAGITVRGEKPRLLRENWRAAAERNWVLDWSGNTTYWVSELQVTEEGGRRAIQELAAAFPDMRIIEVHWDYSVPEGKRRYVPRRTILQCDRAALLGFGVDEAKLARMLGRDHVMLAELDEVFAHHLDFQFTWDKPADQSVAELMSARHGRPVVLPESELSASMETQFATSDPRGKTYTEALLRTLGTCFSTWIEEIDLGTGETIGGAKRSMGYSSDLREWCAAGSQRYLRCYTETTGRKRDIGIRACNAPV